MGKRSRTEKEFKVGMETQVGTFKCGVKEATQRVPRRKKGEKRLKN